MLQSFKPSIGCTILDVCLNVYCSLNLLSKLILDNNIQDLNRVTSIGDVFVYDTDFVADEFLQNDILKNNYKFVTGKLAVSSSPVIVENYLLIESSDILKSEAGNLFLI